MLRMVGTLSFVFLIAFSATSQDQTVTPTIENTASATVAATPDYVEFWLHREGAGATYVAATEAALRLEPTLRQALEERKLSPIEIHFSGLAIPESIMEPKGSAASLSRAPRQAAYQSARLQFPGGAFTTGEDGPKQLAALCDTMQDLAKELKCSLEGPILGVKDTEALRQSAIARALENAYPAAEGAARLMRTNIMAVEKVQIEDIEWNADPDSRSRQPDLHRVTCTARVRVTYSIPAAP